jgi:hypothetical protein
MFGQMAPMGARSFDIALDIEMLKDAIVNHRLPVQDMLVAPADGDMTPGQVEMTPYDSVLPGWSEHSFKADTAAFDDGMMAFITQTIAEHKANAMQIIENASHDKLKANPGMIIRELLIMFAPAFDNSNVKTSVTLSISRCLIPQDPTIPLHYCIQYEEGKER